MRLTASDTWTDLTITPVLGFYLLPQARFLDERGDPFLLRWLKSLTERLLRFMLRHAGLVLGITCVVVVLSVTLIVWMGGEFLPPFMKGR